MPAKSKKQQMAMGMALAAREGDLPKSSLHGAAKEIEQSSMTNKEIRDFAKTSRKNLPMKSLKECLWESIIGSMGMGDVKRVKENLTIIVFQQLVDIVGRENIDYIEGVDWEREGHVLTFHIDKDWMINYTSRELKEYIVKGLKKHKCWNHINSLIDININNDTFISTKDNVLKNNFKVSYDSFYDPGIYMGLSRENYNEHCEEILKILADDGIKYEEN